jgi:hypothetical protein
MPSGVLVPISTDLVGLRRRGKTRADEGRPLLMLRSFAGPVKLAENDPQAGQGSIPTSLRAGEKTSGRKRLKHEEGLKVRFLGNAPSVRFLMNSSSSHKLVYESIWAISRGERPLQAADQLASKDELAARMATSLPCRRLG